MKCVKTSLGNGLRLLTIPMPSLESATVTIWAGVGSRYEPKHLNGLAHFFEHIVFKGSAKRPSAKAISEAIDSFGGEFNAFTGKELTAFYIKAPVTHLEDAIDILSDMILNPLIPAIEIEREKNVIAAEIDMIEDTPMRNVANVYHSLVFKGSPLEHPVIGSKKTVHSIVKKDFLTYKSQFYTPQNIVITLAGGVTPARAKTLINQSFGQMKGHPFPKSFGTSLLPLTKPRLKLQYKKTDQAHIMIGYLGDKLLHQDHYAEDVLCTLLGGGMSSRLFLQIRERRGLCYAIKSSIHPYLTAGTFVTYVGCHPRKASEATKAILAEYQKFTRLETCHISKTELKKAKEYIKGHFALDFESTNEVGEFFGGEEVLLGKNRTIKEVYQGIDQVSVSDIVRVAQKFFRPERLSLALIGPIKSEAKFQTALYPKV
jgi:predicted Zn-dependent peptidase